MPTVGEAITKISELQSRWAILHELVTYLETHFKASDAGPAELKILREDRAVVPEMHIDVQLASLTHEMDQIKLELDGWEDLKILEPGDDSAKKPATKKRKRSATASQRTDQPGARDDGQEGSGQAA